MKIEETILDQKTCATLAVIYYESPGYFLQEMLLRYDIPAVQILRDMEGLASGNIDEIVYQSGIAISISKIRPVFGYESY